MAVAQKITIMDASVEKIQEVLTDYESYPDFMDGVSNVEILSDDDTSVKAKYSLNIIKKFTYTLDHKVEPGKISWSFVDGDIFSVNEGTWTLKDLGDGTTEVTYDIEIEIKIKMMGVGMITKKLVKTSLPGLMREIEQRAQDL